MTDRDKLIQDLLPITDNYLNTSEDKHFTPNTTIADVADLLIEKGWIRPPCKVGDKVYYMSKNPINLSVLPYTIYEADIVRIVTTKFGTSLAIQIHNEYGCTEIPNINDFGKTVFLTKEEAEEKLRELRK